MLETLVPSRIRRALFEYLLTHPGERFYLRGLAKELGVSITPLRRELKRLELGGVLRAVTEGSIRFYEQLPGTPLVPQMERAVPASTATSVAAQPASAASDLAGVAAKAPSSALAPHALSPAAEGVALLRTPLIFGAVLLSFVLALVVAGLWQLRRMEERLTDQPASARPAVVQPLPLPGRISQPPASGGMRGARWQLLPGNFGGFSQAAGDSEAL